MVIFPPSPTASDSARLTILLGIRLEDSPSIRIVSLTVTFTEPAFPPPNVEAITIPPLARDIEPAVTVMSPAFPTASDSTRFVMPLLSIFTLSVALTIISPACVSESVESEVIPAAIELKLKPNSPACKLRLRALIIIFPPPVPLTSTSPALLKAISALDAFSGKFKLPSSSIVTVPDSDKPPSSILPPEAVAFPPSKRISPPRKVIFSPGVTSKPTKLSGLSPTLERLTISPGLSPIFNPIGVLIVKSGSVGVSVALNSTPLGNKILSAVLP